MDIVQLKKKLEDRRRHRDQAEGALKQQLKELESKFGYKDEKSAKKEIERIEEEIREVTAELTPLVEEFQSEFGERLDIS